MKTTSTVPMSLALKKTPTVSQIQTSLWTTRRGRHIDKEQAWTLAREGVTSACSVVMLFVGSITNCAGDKTSVSELYNLMTKSILAYKCMLYCDVVCEGHH